MNDTAIYLIAADSILMLHLLFVAYVVLGLALILSGKILSWDWVHHFWFRLTHLAAIAYVVMQSWLGAICPLTLWEQHLRRLAGEATYSGAFIAHWIHALLYYSAPDWVFILLYSLFGGLVATSWFWVRPRR